MKIRVPRGYPLWPYYIGFIVIALSILASALWAEILLYSQNTLFLNNEWTVSKRQAEIGVMGGDEFLLLRDPLAGKVLNLGAWYGAQEVVFKAPLRPQRIFFRFKVPRGSYVDFTFGRQMGHFSGLRISYDPSFPSASFESTDDGGFLRMTPISNPSLTEGWHRASIDFSETGQQSLPLQIAAQIDDQIPIRISYRDSAQGRIGFRGALGGAWIDGISIIDHDGQRLEPSFNVTDKWTTAMAFNFSFLSFLALLITIRKQNIFSLRLFAFNALALSLMACIFGGLWYSFDFYYWSALPNSALMHPLPSEEHKIPSQTFDHFRYGFFSEWYQLIGGETITLKGVSDRGYPMTRIWQGPIYCGPELFKKCGLLDDKELEKLKSSRKNSYRILFIGSSQTVGACAQKLEHTFFSRVHHSLSRSLAPSRTLESLNISVSGSNAERLYNDYEQRYQGFTPNLTVINLSVNDALVGFSTNIGKFLNLNRQKGIKTVLLEEAATSSYDNEKELEMHRVLREAAWKYGATVLPLHDYLHQPAQRGGGELWCDMAHLTSYGQDLIARWLAPKLLALIQ